LPTSRLVQGELLLPDDPRRSHIVRIRSVFSHSAQAVVEGALISLLVVGLMAGTAFAAKGGGGGHGKPGSGSGGGTISLASPLVVDNNGNGSPNWRDVVRFNVSTSTTQPYVNLYCYQNGAFVAGGSEGYFAGALDDGNFGLYGGSWAGGAADCTAKLVNSSGSVLGSTSFHVDA
jgi:hypothetical protein